MRPVLQREGRGARRHPVDHGHVEFEQMGDVRRRQEVGR